MTRQHADINLEGKCGGCIYGEPCQFRREGGLSYVRCLKPNAKWRKEYQQYKCRSQKGCKAYMPKGE